MFYMSDVRVQIKSNQLQEKPVVNFTNSLRATFNLIN